jgi:hypothetical protein
VKDQAKPEEVFLGARQGTGVVTCSHFHRSTTENHFQLSSPTAREKGVDGVEEQGGPDAHAPERGKEARVSDLRLHASERSIVIQEWMGQGSGGALLGERGRPALKAEPVCQTFIRAPYLHEEAKLELAASQAPTMCCLTWIPMAGSGAASSNGEVRCIQTVDDLSSSRLIR